MACEAPGLPWLFPDAKRSSFLEILLFSSPLLQVTCRVSPSRYPDRPEHA